MTYENGKNSKALAPQESGIPKQRSIEVVHTYLQKGQGFTRSVWIKVSPKNLVLRLMVIPSLVLIGSLIFILILLALSFTLMALYLYWSLSRQRREEGA